MSQTPYKMICVSSPKLWQIDKAYHNTASQEYIVILLDYIEMCSGKVNKLTNAQKIFLSNQISAVYSQMTLTQLVLFVYEYLRGTFGQDYGSIDPTHILQSLETYYRTTVQNIIERKKQKEYFKRLEEEAKSAISYKEYLKTKKA